MSDDQLLPESWTLGQCVYRYDSGDRCQMQATKIIKIATLSGQDAYGYCLRHFNAITKPRDPRLHRTAERLTRVEEETK